MSVETYKDLKQHYGHEVVVAQYTDSEGDAAAYAVECNDCDEVILNYDKEDASDE
jgi:hypothetical protein